MSARIAANASGVRKPQRVVVVGGGDAGADLRQVPRGRGPPPRGPGAGKVLGGKVSAWQDADGDWIDRDGTSSRALYPNMMNLFAELKIEDRLQWRARDDAR